MRTVKWNPFLSGVCTFLGGMLLWAGAARADVSATNPAAIVVFPKVVVDVTATTRIDTVIQLTNTSDIPVNVRCFLVNANGHCSDNPDLICDPNAPQVGTTPGLNVNPCDEFGFCVPGWQESDFRFRLTGKQPIYWKVSEGDSDLPLSDSPGPTGEFNDGSILPAPENPMMGELKCIEVGDNEEPTDKNDLKGEATIERVSSAGPTVDIRGYNAIGIQAIPGENDGNDTLVLGQEYNPCPNILVLDHFFDDAEEPSNHATVRTHLTLVPCTEDFNLQFPLSTTVQYLVYNEFEQRFSTSKSMRCFSEIPLSDIDTRPGETGDAQSIFNVNVQGTLTGQSLIRGVADLHDTHGHGLLALAEEFHCSAAASCGTKNSPNPTFSAAFIPQNRGTREQKDFVQLPAAQPPAP